MIWAILYFIGIVICYGTLLYVSGDVVSYESATTILICLMSLVWPIVLFYAIVHVLGYCIKLFLTKIIKTK